MNRPERLAGRVWCTKSQVEPGNSNSEGKRETNVRVIMVVLYLLPSQWVPVLAPTPLLQLPAPGVQIVECAVRSKRAGTSYYFSCGPNTFSHCDEETGAAYLRAVTENSTKSPFFMCGQEPNYPIWFRAIQDSVNIPEVALFINSRGFNSSIILLHEKFLQFDWLRAVVFQLNLKYLHVKTFVGSSINK